MLPVVVSGSDQQRPGSRARCGAALLQPGYSAATGAVQGRYTPVTAMLAKQREGRRRESSGSFRESGGKRRKRARIGETFNISVLPATEKTTPPLKNRGADVFNFRLWCPMGGAPVFNRGGGTAQQAATRAIGALLFIVQREISRRFATGIATTLLQSLFAKRKQVTRFRL